LILDLHRQLQITTVMVTHNQQEAVVMADQIALLFDGKLRQVGKPHTFYQRPIDVQTARFFGGVNFIPGVRHGARVETSLGVFPAPEHCDVAGECFVTVRQEDLDLDSGTPDAVSARVASSLYMGTQTRFKVCVGEIELTVEGAAASFDRFHVGDAVKFAIPVDKLWLLPRETHIED
jgi:ABC-type Fe3+/spermidine/putrescine transport system ATPase subunit